MADEEVISAWDQVRSDYGRRWETPMPTPANYPDPPFSRGRVAAFLDDSAQLDSVKWVVKWQMGFNTSHFAHALQEAIMYADDGNLMRLALGFPHEVMGFLSYRFGHLADELEKAGIVHKDH